MSFGNRQAGMEVVVTDGRVEQRIWVNFMNDPNPAGIVTTG
jgi:hypothetical protein